MVNDTSTAPNKKQPAKKAKKTGVSVKQLATDIGVSVERLLLQFKDAAIEIAGEDDIVSDAEKQELLGYLKNITA